MFIDPPSLAASLAEWEEYLAELKDITPSDEDVLLHIDEAEKMIDNIKNGKRIFSSN